MINPMIFVLNFQWVVIRIILNTAFFLLNLEA